MIERFDSLVSMMTGVLLPEARSVSSIVGPSMTGIVTSSRIRSTETSRSFARPCSPSSACSIMKPRSPRVLLMMLRMVLESSTVRLCGITSSDGAWGKRDDQADRLAGMNVVGPGQIGAELVETARHAERLVERELALDLAGRHDDELAHEVVDHVELEVVLVDHQHGGRERDASRAIGREGDAHRVGSGGAGH